MIIDAWFSEIPSFARRGRGGWDHVISVFQIINLTKDYIVLFYFIYFYTLIRRNYLYGGRQEIFK